MQRITHLRWMAATVLGLALSPVVALGQQIGPADITKRRLEVPAKELIVTKPKRADIGKAMIEMPVKLALANGTDSGFVNPKVAAGKVKWHPDFATACEAAKKSGKPVLLFHLMGQLDLQFC